MSTDPILFEIRGPIAIITINLPHKLNALSGELYRRIGFHLQRIALMPDITITILTGRGRFFSAGMDFTAMKGTPPITTTSSGEEDTKRTFWLRQFAASNMEVTKAFLEHPKLLIVALNGPAVGLSAALVAHADFIYCTSSTFLLTPFTTLGLVAEGGSSYTFIQRLGPAKANEALILSKQLSAQDLLSCGFVNKVYPTPSNPNDATGFVETVIEDVKREFLERGLNRESMLEVKRLIKDSFRSGLMDTNVKEAFSGLERFLSGVPLREFEAFAKGEKKHKL